MTTNPWPELHLSEWKDTYDTLHMWTQIIGKIRLALTPLVNHWWNITLYTTPRGLTTSTMSYNGRLFQINFDFIAHLLLIETTYILTPILLSYVLHFPVFINKILKHVTINAKLIKVRKIIQFTRFDKRNFLM
jgi:Family of unknown function (DUF5996)